MIMVNVSTRRTQKIVTIAFKHLIHVTAIDVSMLPIRIIVITVSGHHILKVATDVSI